MLKNKTSIEAEELISKLQAEYERRKKGNPRYSLRSFAANLDIGVSTLSEILAGKRKLGKIVTRQLKEKLPQLTLTSTNDLDEIQINEFDLEILCDWKPYAILEVIGLKNFNPSVSWIAKRIQSSVTEVENIIAALKKVEALKISNGKWIDLWSNARTQRPLNLSTSWKKNLQKQFLGLSRDAIEKFDVNQRLHSTLMMKINKAELETLRNEIAAFHEKMNELTKKSKRSKDSVYVLQMSFFPVIDSGE